MIHFAAAVFAAVSAASPLPGKVSHVRPTPAAPGVRLARPARQPRLVQGLPRAASISRGVLTQEIRAIRAVPMPDNRDLTGPLRKTISLLNSKRMEEGWGDRIRAGLVKIMEADPYMRRELSAEQRMALARELTKPANSRTSTLDIVANFFAELDTQAAQPPRANGELPQPKNPASGREQNDQAIRVLAGLYYDQHLQAAYPGYWLSSTNPYWGFALFTDGVNPRQIKIWVGLGGISRVEWGDAGDQFHESVGG